MLGGHGWSCGGVTMATLIDAEFPSNGFPKESKKEDSHTLRRLSLSVQTQGIQMECFLIKLLLSYLSIIMMH